VLRSGPSFVENGKPLPLKKIVEKGLSITWENKFSLFCMLIIPYFISTLLAFIQIPLSSSYGNLAGFSVLLLISLISTLYISSCHRFVLLGKKSVPAWGILIPGKREFKFLGWMIALTIIFSIFALLEVITIGLTGVLFGFLKVLPNTFILLLIFLPWGYLFSRWILIFPAVAIDERPDLKWSWDKSRGNGWRLFLLASIPFIPGAFFSIFLPAGRPLLLDGLLVCLNFVLTVLAIILISLSYEELCMHEDLSEQPR